MLTQPFRPAPALVPVRVTLTVLALAAGRLLLYAVPQDWWVVDDFLHDQIVTTDGSDAFVRTMVVAGLAERRARREPDEFDLGVTEGV
jgi:hypothetical protein